jgi:DnaK suppressor protein
MKEEELEQLKVKIGKKIKRVKADIEHLVELTQPIAPENALGRVTRMDAINNKSVNEAALRQAKLTLGKLEYSLQRIENNDPAFGQCSQCGEPIPMPRLLLMPESDKCVNCAR